MKQFKFMSFMLALLACVFTFSACGDDDEDDNGGETPATALSQKIVGTWRTYQVAFAVYGGMQYSEPVSKDSPAYIELVFNDNGTAGWYGWVDSINDVEVGKFMLMNTYDYAVEGNKVILSLLGTEVQVLEYQSRENALVWVDEGAEADDGEASMMGQMKFYLRK